MEGTLNNVAEKVGDLRVTVDRHNIEINDLKLGHQQLVSDAAARELQVVATAKALADADEARRVAADSRWSPAMRFTAIFAGLATVISGLATAYIATHG